MSKGSVLVVEDDMDSYELVRIILERNGFDTFLAVNGRDGVLAARKQKPDLILMDLSLPEMDGWEATRRIKADPKTASIPLVVLTAHALPDDRQRAMDAGCDAFITKPINLGELVRVVNGFAKNA